MKFKNINYKRVVYLFITGFIIVNIVGCSKTNNISANSSYKQEYNQLNDKENTFKSDNDVTDNNTKLNEINTDSIINENISNDNVSMGSSKPQNNTNVTKEETVTYTESDMKAIDTFTNFEKEVDTMLKSETSENIKDKAKGTFISIVDFIFYDSQINGVTFNELTDAGKEKVLSIANSIDYKIENKYPNYKETISDKTKEAFNKASVLIKKGADNIKDFSKEKLGENNYNAIIDAKDDLVYYTKKAVSIIGEVGSKLYEKGKNYIKNWYENLKNN